MGNVKYVDLDGLSHFKAKMDNEYIKNQQGKGLSTNDYTTEEKTKLAGLNNYDDSAITSALANKVDKVSGKSLSTNDFTAAYKSKIDSIDAGANKNIIETIKRNGVELQVDSKKGVDINVPTDNNQLTNGAGYQTANQVESAIVAKGYQTANQVSTAIANAINNVQGISYSIVSSLPSTGKAGVIYLIGNSGTNSNIYDEYIWVNEKFEKLGTTDVDLSGYIKNSEIISITNAEIDAIFEA